jgi:exopolysaccharide production protein ExoZ
MSTQARVAQAAPSSAPKAATTTNRLGWVELGRGLAALVVALVHASDGMRETQYSGAIFMERWFFWGFLGVDFFFVLSGFIILYVHFHDLGQPQKMRRYAWRRVTRIFPTYWIILALGLVFNALIQSDKAPISGPWLVEQFMLVPGIEPWLGPAWTLRFELLFYAIFLLLLVHKRLGMFALFAWLILISVTSLKTGSFEDGSFRRDFWHVLTSPYNYNFFFGMGLAWVFRSGRGLGALTLAFAVLGALFIFYSLINGIHWHSWIRYPGCGVVCAALLGGLLLISQRGWHLPASFTFLGAISYSLYLSHVLFMGYYLAVLSKLGVYPHLPEWIIFVTQLIVGVMCAWLVYRVCETPILKWAHSKFNN